MLILLTGDGKGKTSSALGVALRSFGWGRRVAIVQFIKGNKEVGEWKALEKISGIEIYQFFDDSKLSITDKTILENPAYKEACQNAWDFGKDLIENQKADLVILDEICNAIFYGLIDKKDVLDFVETRRGVSDLDIMLTGRNAPQELIDLSDLVSEMNEIKHPFQNGIPAKRGIDY